MSADEVEAPTFAKIDKLTPEEIFAITTDDNLFPLLSEELLTALQRRWTVLKNTILHPSD